MSFSLRSSRVGAFCSPFVCGLRSAAGPLYLLYDLDTRPRLSREALRRRHSRVQTNADGSHQARSTSCRHCRASCTPSIAPAITAGGGSPHAESEGPGVHSQPQRLQLRLARPRAIGMEKGEKLRDWRCVLVVFLCERCPRVARWWGKMREGKMRARKGRNGEVACGKKCARWGSNPCSFRYANLSRAP